MNGPIRLAAADIITEDNNWFKLPQSLHDRLVNDFNLHPFHKKAVSLDALTALIAQLDIRAPRVRRSVEAGGSAGTTTRTLQKLIGNSLDVTFCGITGGTPYSPAIRERFAEAGVRMLLPQEPCHLSARTVALLPESGGKTLATWPGNYGAVIAESVTPEKLLAGQDILILTGNNLKPDRWGEKLFNDVLAYRWKHGIECVLTLPTDRAFAAENAGYLRWLVASMNGVICNMDEASAVAGTKNRAEIRQMFQAAFRETVLPATRGRLGREPFFFATDDANETSIVTAEDIFLERPAPIPPHEIRNQAGAGDTAAAFILYAQMTGDSYRAGVRNANRAAGLKMRDDAPCLDNPAVVLDGDRRGSFAHDGHRRAILGWPHPSEKCALT